MKIKTLSIIAVVFFAGMVCMGTYALADDQGQGDDLPDSVMDELQPLPGQNPNPSGPPDEYETERTPDGNIKKPPAPGKDGKPVKYTDEDGDKYWGTDGFLYPWPPPMTVLEAAEWEVSSLEEDEQDFLLTYAVDETMLNGLYDAALGATETNDLESSAEIAEDIENTRKSMSEIKKKLKELRKKIKAAKAKKKKLEEKITKEKLKKLKKLKKKVKTGRRDKRIKVKKAMDKGACTP